MNKDKNTFHWFIYKVDVRRNAAKLQFVNNNNNKRERKKKTNEDYLSVISLIFLITSIN